MRTRTSREEQVASNRQQVLAAARRVFLARGYASATVDAIAEEAGFTKGVVYSQFESKADMFLALLEARISERRAQNEALAAQLEPGELASAIPELAFALRRAEPGWAQLVLEFRVHAARVPELNRRYAQLHERTVQGLTSVLEGLHRRAGTQPRYPLRGLAELALAINVGSCIEQLANPEALDLPVAEIQGQFMLAAAPAPPAASG
jgi:AcrR family transcriptional regulator